MEAQIKEETKEVSLCFESSGENLASLSLVEKYDRFLQNDNSDPDSDGDFFPDDRVLKEEYAHIRNDTANYNRTNKNHRLSTGLPGRYKSIDTNSSVADEETRNGATEAISESRDEKNEKSSFVGLNELIEKLELVRRCDPDGNSIFCTESELEAIQERYGEILDFMHEKSSTFERTVSSKDLATQQPDEQIRETENNVSEQSEDFRLLADKMETVQRARDRFYEVEQQVREQLDQLELVERYKMESVG